MRRAFAGALLPEAERDLLDLVKRDLLPPEDAAAGEQPSEIGHAGFSLRVEAQLALLQSFRDPRYVDLFAVLRADPHINVGFDGRDYGPEGLIHNGYYPTPDAELYAALILHFKPETIVEVGSGFSTAIARAAIKAGGLDSQLHVIDPEPRRSVEGIADRIEYSPVESSSLAESAVPSHSLLFLDSSHITRSGGDGPFLFCSLLPDLPSDVLVHVHDVFLPYDYPDVYVKRLYTEQYLLHALLADSAKFRVVFATHFMGRAHRREMQSVFGDAVGGEGLFGGASFWFEST